MDSSCKLVIQLIPCNHIIGIPLSKVKIWPDCVMAISSNLNHMVTIRQQDVPFQTLMEFLRCLDIGMCRVDLNTFHCTMGTAYLTGYPVCLYSLFDWISGLFRAYLSSESDPCRAGNVGRCTISNGGVILDIMASLEHCLMKSSITRN